MTTTAAADKLSFSACCRMLEAVERTPKSEAKLRLVFSEDLRNELGGGDIYPLMRLVLPQLDRERTYNLKEKKIGKIYVDVLGMASESKDAQKLERFNDPTVVQTKAVGDFAAVLFDVLQYRSLAGNKKHQHTVGYANQLLDQLVQAEDNKVRKHVFMTIATEFAPNEQKWLVRIILKDLKIGLRHERVLSYIHPDAMEMYNHTNDLHRVCLELRNSSVRYVAKIEPFLVFSPMLSKRVDFGECTTAINADEFVMEPKLDGERITCHVQDGQVQFISRNGINYTELYGPFMAPYVLSQLLPGVSCILDGEMMVWDNMDYHLREFGLLKTVANALRTGDSPHRWLCYVVWDVVYLGGDPAPGLIREVFRGPGEVSAVMGLPLRARRKLLERLLKPLDHRIMIIQQTVVNAKSAKERHELVMAEVDRQIANGGEGVILKDLNAHYMCGESSRKTKKWIKLKPDYAGMTTNLDVLIIGGFYGTGRRRSGDVSVFLLGVLSRSLDEKAVIEASKPGSEIPTIYTFAKVGTGYNLEELAQMRSELEPHWVPWDNDNIPPHLNGWKPQKSDLKPDFWIDPRHSKILEVYGFELTFTSLYQTGLTIRFPRCKSIRNDKPWYECLTAQDLNAIRGGIYNKRAADVALGQKKVTKRPVKRQVVFPSRPSGSVLSTYSQAELSGLELKHDIFEGKELCVLPGRYPKPVGWEIPEKIRGTERSVSKQLLEKLLHSYGASIVQNPVVASTDYVIAASDSGIKVDNLKKQGLFNIVSVRWIYECIQMSRLIRLGARDFVFATEAMRSDLDKEYDRFGDHFVEAVKPEELSLIFQEVNRQAEKCEDMMWKTASVELLEEQEAFETEFTFLSHCKLYIDQYETIQTAIGATVIATSPRSKKAFEVDVMRTIAQQIRLYGGRIATKITKDVTHVVLRNAMDQERIQLFVPIVRAIRHKHSREPALVSTDWVEDCIREHQQLPVDAYIVRI
ncbi:TPA: hypothetical protein N0F65_010033 [Lagenidium giganteum]|uniref:DNA ligase n=1 Tax=Lagenidium giganteum TaxID=4803 RepID=A0AAV2ZHJ3_9STRA|nr:TPA: hypothetical protein N0F65_010033 [Lagenidium giganteum]